MTDTNQLLTIALVGSGLWFAFTGNQRALRFNIGIVAGLGALELARRF